MILIENLFSKDLASFGFTFNAVSIEDNVYIGRRQGRKLYETKIYI